MHLVIIDSPNAVFSEPFDQLILWQSYNEAAFPNAVSIPSLVEKNADYLRSRYLKFIHELGEVRVRRTKLYESLELRPEFSYWWMTLMVEKCNWAKSPLITDVIRLFAFDDWAAGYQNIKSIKLVSPSLELQECLKNWCRTKGIFFKCHQLVPKTEAKSALKRVFDRLPHTTQAVLWLLKYLIDRWSLRGVGVEEWKRGTSQITFVSYLFNLHPKAAQLGRFESNYWTELPKILDEEKIQSSWLHTYVKNSVAPNAKAARELLQSFNAKHEGKQVHATLDSFLGVKTIAGAIRDYIKIRKLSWFSTAIVQKCLKKETQSIESLLWPLFKKDWEQSLVGVDAIRNLLTLNLYEDAFSYLPRQSSGVYLQENQGWEFGMIHAWRTNSHGSLTGFPHSTVRYWDLRHFFDLRSYCQKYLSIPLPDYQAVTGNEIKSAFIAGGYPCEALIEVEALRFLYLDKIGGRQIRKRSSSQKLQLLVLGEYSSKNTSLQMNFLMEIADELLNVELTVKPHPACPINPADYPELEFEVSNQPLSDLFEMFDIAYTSCLTSAAVDAYCAGLRVISVLDPAGLNLSPLRGVKGVQFVSSSEELKEAVFNVSEQSDSVIETIDYFNVDSSLPRWRTLILNELRCNETK